MATSEVDIANMALGFLGEPRITDIADNDDCSNNYPICRDACLEEIDWTFAMERFLLDSPDTTNPAFGHSYRFLIPPRVLRVVSVNGNVYEWEKESNYILTDEATCEVRAVVRVEDVRRFTPGFVQALAARLAATIAISVTSSKSVSENMWGMYGAFKLAAQGNDGRQGRTVQMTRKNTRRSRQ